MEEGGNRGDLLLNLARLPSLRPSGSLKPTSSGRSTPRGSPSFRRLNSTRTSRREGRSNGSSFQWFRSNRLLLWLLLITLWSYAGFYVQSRWAHGDKKEGFVGYGRKPKYENSESKDNHRPDLIENGNSSSAIKIGNDQIRSTFKNIDVVLAKKENVVPSQKTSKKKSKSKRPDLIEDGNSSSAIKTGNDQIQSNFKNIDVVLAKENVVPSQKPPKKKSKSKRSARGSRNKTRGKQKAMMEVETAEIEGQEPEIPKRNTSYGLLVGPFGLTEDRILEWSPEKRTGTCDRKGKFARLIWSRKFFW
ncbi:hypothetical protein U1Q18_044866 [Sarracenia purpurea var. burkii]